MDFDALINKLDKISNDDNKNLLLKNSIGNQIEWFQIKKILVLYQTNKRIECLKLILDSSKIIHLLDVNLIDILELYLDDKNILSAINILLKYIKIINGQILLIILNKISSDLYKLEALHYLIKKSNCQFDEVLSLIQNFSNDSLKFDALKIFVNNYLIETLNNEQLCKIIEIFKSNLIKTLIIEYLKDNISRTPFLLQDNFCKRLSELIDEQDLYYQALSYLYINKQFIEKNKPI